MSNRDLPGNRKTNAETAAPVSQIDAAIGLLKRLKNSLELCRFNAATGVRDIDPNLSIRIPGMNSN